MRAAKHEEHEQYIDLLESEALAHVATIGPKGEPQSNPVWFDWDGTYILFSQTKDRAFINAMAKKYLGLDIFPVASDRGRTRHYCYPATAHDHLVLQSHLSSKDGRIGGVNMHEHRRASGSNRRPRGKGH